MSQPQPEVSRACLGVIAFFLPPLAVFMVRGCGTSFWINLILFVRSPPLAPIRRLSLTLRSCSSGYLP